MYLSVPDSKCSTWNIPNLNPDFRPLNPNVCHPGGIDSRQQPKAKSQRPSSPCTSRRWERSTQPLTPSELAATKVPARASRPVSDARPGQEFHRQRPAAEDEQQEMRQASGHGGLLLDDWGDALPPAPHAGVLGVSEVDLGEGARQSSILASTKTNRIKRYPRCANAS